MNTVLLILVVGIVIGIVLYLLLRPAKADKYNEAVKLYGNLRYLLAQDRILEYKRILVNLIEVCQSAIMDNPRNGDAYVMLGNAFTLAAPLSDYEYFDKLAVAVLYEQESKGYRARASKGNGAILMDGIMRRQPHFQNQLLELNNRYLLEALNPQKLSYFKELLGVA